MASNNHELKRRRNSDPDDKNPLEKRQRPETEPLATSSQLVQAMNVELSNASCSKRARSKSSDSPVRNVRAKMTVDLSSSSPVPATFLMGAIANELENINRMLSVSGGSSSSGVTDQSLSSSHSSTHSSPPSSPDFYDRLVTRGYEMMDRLRQDPDLKRFI